MVNSVKSKSDEPKKVAVACQGGGMHAAFTVGVLTEILNDIEKQEKWKDKKRFKLVGLSGTSAGALCALMVWYGLAPKQSGSSSSADEARRRLNDFWNEFVAKTEAETVLNFLTYRTFWLEEQEIPRLGVNAPIFGSLNPYGEIFKAVADWLPGLGVRKEYFDLNKLLTEACPALENDSIKWQEVKTRLLIGASEVVNGFETVFDSDVQKKECNTKTRECNTSKVLKGRIGTGASAWRSVCRVSPRQGHYPFSARRSISMGTVIIGTAFTRRIHQCGNLLRELTRCPTNCGSCASILSNGHVCPSLIRTSRTVRMS